MSDIPVFDSLNFYAYPDVQVKRYNDLYANFKATYGTSPEFIARSPGRVNLIGEHLDYSYFPVIPLAIEVDVLIAVKVNGTSEIRLKNSDPAFTDKVIELPKDGSLITVDKNPNWSDYFKCGLLVAHQFLKENSAKHDKNRPVKGLDILIDGNVPTGGGLSSSAAFICATALAILKSNDLEEGLLTKDNLCKICTVSERYVGVNTGGMDQTASICGVKNNALFVQFKPKISATPFEFPKTTEPFEVLIANTLVVSNKEATAPRNYNLRAVEVGIAAEALERNLNIRIPRDSGLDSGTLKGVMDVYFKDKEVTVAKLEKLTELVEVAFASKKEFTSDEAAKALGISLDEFTKRFLTRNEVIFEHLKLYKRAKHVYTETARVAKAIELLKKTPADDDFLEKFGKLMNESQASCRDDYQCSCPEIDELCQLALANGSYGSRLTGAGWGGCTVHLVPTSKLGQIKNALINDYYKKKSPNITEAELQEAIVLSRPAWGSSLYFGTSAKLQ